jgi:hypothetical protein
MGIIGSLLLWLKLRERCAASFRPTNATAPSSMTKKMPSRDESAGEALLLEGGKVARRASVPWSMPLPSLPRLWWLPFVLAGVGVAACGSDERRSNDDDDGGSTTSISASGGATSGPGSGGSAGSSGSGASSGAGGSAPQLDYCLPACASAGDCDLGAGPAWDADNYLCDGGACKYQGCNSDSECMAQGNMVCRDSNDVLGLGSSLSCVFTCATAADCDYGGGPAYDGDNYACSNGGCIYTGCNSDSECMAQGNLVCHDTGAGLSLCTYACTTPADCDYGGGAAYDADNYSCLAGACEYQGCNSTSECMSLGNHVCTML